MVQRTIILLAFLTLSFGCTSRKYIETAKEKSNSSTQIDSSYNDTNNTEIKAFRTTRINFDSSGKPTTIDIKEVVKSSKKQLKKGSVKKKIEESKVVKQTLKEKEKINYLPLFISTGVILVLVFFIHSKK